MTPPSETVHLVAGILERGGRLLLVASRYRNHADALWNLPGGRRRAGELLDDALRREFLEETGLAVTARRLAYVSESYDSATGTHFLCVVFEVAAAGAAAVSGLDAHVVECAWVARERLTDYLRVAVVREPLLAYLREPEERYFRFSDAGITIEFADEA